LQEKGGPGLQILWVILFNQ